MLQAYFDIDALFDVPADAFDPPPAVTSAVVRLTPIAGAEAAIDDRDALSRLVAQAFSQRRKTLRNSLATIVAEDELAAAGIDPKLRAENVAVADWIALANRLSDQ